MIRIISISEVCARTNLSRATIYRLVRKGRLKPPKVLSENRVGWDEADIEQFLRDRRSR